MSVRKADLQIEKLRTEINKTIAETARANEDARKARK